LRGGAAEEGRLEAELRGRSGSRVPLDVGVHFGVCQFGIPASESIAECVLEQSYGPRLATNGFEIMTQLNAGPPMSRESADRIPVKSLIRQMSADLLSFTPGTFLGVEEEMRRRYNVSRPTLRQAARVLEHQQLLRVKPGAGGGYYVTRPNGADVISAAVSYLRSQGLTLAGNIFAAQSMRDSVVRLAAMSADRDRREALKTRRDRYAALDLSKITVPEFLEAEVELHRAVTHLAGNVALEFIESVLFEFGAEDPQNATFEGHPERIRKVVSLRLDITNAILAGDAEVAHLYSARLAELIRQWVDADGAAPPSVENQKRREPSYSEAQIRLNKKTAGRNR